MFDLPQETYLVVVQYDEPRLASPDVVTSLDDAADAFGEMQKLWGDKTPMRVLRIAHSLNTDDVTWQVLDVIARRAAQRERAA